MFTPKTKKIGVITYNATTGQMKQCDVYEPFWTGNLPDQYDCHNYLIKHGYGLIRPDTIRYVSLIKERDKYKKIPNSVCKESRSLPALLHQ